jgi:hypothetical protein
MTPRPDTASRHCVRESAPGRTTQPRNASPKHVVFGTRDAVVRFGCASETGRNADAMTRGWESRYSRFDNRKGVT